MARLRHRSRTAVTSVIALLALSIANPLGYPATAQEAPCDVSPRVGVTVPAGELNEIVDPGVEAGITASCPVSSRLRIAGGVDVGVPRGDESDLTLFHFLAGPQLAWGGAGEGARLKVAAELGWTVAKSLGDFVLVDPPRADLVESSFTAGARVRAGHGIGSSVTAFVEAGWRTLFVNSEPSGFLADEEGFDTATVFPFTVGLQIGL